MSKSSLSNGHPCECGLWQYRDGQKAVTTGCHRQVSGSRRFAQGHDAVLKSLFIRAGIAGADVTRADGRTFGPTRAAEQFGFGMQVSADIAKGRAKAEATAARARERTSRPRKVTGEGAGASRDPPAAARGPSRQVVVPGR